MAKEQSAGVVIFRRANGDVRYLLLHYATKNKHWDFPKGKIEKGEVPQQTARREAEEETGINTLTFIEGFQEGFSYYFKREHETVFKEVIFFAAETKQENVKISHEHIGYRWLDRDAAIKQLTYENAKELLKKADRVVRSKLH